MADSYTRPDPDTSLIVTVRVDHQLDPGHAMDHFLVVVDLDDDGYPTRASMDDLTTKIRAEMERKVRRRG